MIEKKLYKIKYLKFIRIIIYTIAKTRIKLVLIKIYKPTSNRIINNNVIVILSGPSTA